MNIIQTESLSKDVIEAIKPLDESVLDQIVESAFLLHEDDEDMTVYDRFYKSRYPARDLSSKEQEVMNHINQLTSKYADFIRTNNQGGEYHWVKINTKESDEIMYRFYLAPNPENMHTIVKKLVDKCMMRKIAVRFKFQQNKNNENCDRIIIYSDYAHKNDVEYTLAEIFLEDPKLFEGSEKPLSWMYSTLVPGVCLAPETSGISYGRKFAQTIISAKDIFCYLYGVTDAGEVLQRSQKEVMETKKFMKMLISSLLFRNGLLLDKDDVPFIWTEATPQIRYESHNGVLSSSLYTKDSYCEANFMPIFQGRDAMLKNFYSMPLTKSQHGVHSRCITKEERRREINEALYGKPATIKIKK